MAFGKRRQKRQQTNPKLCVHGFRTKDLLKLLGDNFRNLSQIRYELRKLIARGFVKKKKCLLFYMVTELGYKVLWVKSVSNSCFAEPMISMTYKKTAKQLLSQPSVLESAYQEINDSLSLITKGACCPMQFRGISPYTPEHRDAGRTPFLQVLTAMAFSKTGGILYLATVPKELCLKTAA